MLPKKPRHILYALLLTALSAICTSAIANTKVYELIAEVASVLDTGSEKSSFIPTADIPAIHESVVSSVEKDANVSSSANAFMFATIIQGADQEVGCSTNGLTVARFNLCGDSDNRILSLSGSHSSITWQVLGGGCTPNINDDCPNTTAGCYSTVGSGATFNLNAGTIPATTGAEYRVVVDGVNYYFKVKKSTITQTFVKNDYICGVPGRIQITNLSSAYEFSVNSGSGFGPWQGPIFNNLLPGTYVVKARLKNTPNTCEYPYAPITIVQQDLAIDVTFVDVQCSGDTGSITVTANNVPGPFKYTLLNSSGVPQEFTAFVATNPYTFSAVGFGTYIVQVETQQCTGDPLNGIDPPRQDLDTGGNPIVIGNGLSPLDASTEVNSSFGCSTITDVDITVNTTGGAAPYRFSVNGGPLQPSYTGTTTYTVTAPGTYDFLITDSNGCTISASSNVETLLPPDVTANGINGTCSNGGAKINFTINDAKGYNLSYRVNSGDPWDTNPQISVPAGTYNNIEVLYQQGGFQCTISLPAVTVTNVGAITGSAVKITDRTCSGGGVNGGQIDFVGPFTGGSGGGYVFSIDGLNFSGTTSYPNLVPGTYTPIIQDGGGCRLTLTPITILDVDPPSDITFAQLNISCATSTSDVQLTPTSNAAITNYSIISPVVINNGASNTFIGLSTTTSYIFQITDANNCTYTEGFTPALISSIRARVKSGGDLKVCTGASDGSGTFLIDGFANNYTYNINGGVESGAQNNAQVTIGGLGAGTYTITVTDVDSGCTDSASFDVLEAPSPLTLLGTVTPMSCSNNNLGRVVANASGGWGTNRYTLVYPGGAPTVGPKSGTSFGNLSVAGTYTLSVTDAEGCTATFNFDLTPIDAPSISIDTASSDFCYIPGPGATIAVTSTAGTAPLASHQYRINGGPLQASPLFSGIAPGNYTLEVVDGNSCKDNISVTINPQLRANISIENEIPCGGAPGQIRVVVTGGYTSGAGPKQYEVSADNGVTFAAAVPLTSNNFLYDTDIPGTYVFRITDNNTSNSGCTATSNPIILDPPVNINPAADQVFPPACGETNSGRVIITPDATSGLAPYEINFDGAGWSSNTLYSNLIEGQTYTYTVRDARGCETIPQDVTIPSPGTAPDATVTATPATCFTGSVAGDISVTAVSGGTPDFTYILQDQYGVEIQRTGPTSSTSATFSGVPVGNYMVITLDSNGCLDQDYIRVDDGDLDVVPDPVVTPICTPGGFTNTVTIVGGVGPFEIRLVTDPPSLFVPVNLPPDRHTFAGLQYGVAYTVEVNDLGTGCTHIETIDPIDGPNLDVTASSTPGYCNALRNGQITYSISNFNSGDDLFIEIYNVDTGTLMHSETQNGVTSIPYNGFYDTLPGNYQVIVTNLTDFCTDGALITINQNLPNVYILTAEPANCNADGQFTVVGGGGAGGPYEFAFGLAGFTPDYDGTATPADPTDDFGTTTTFGGPAGTYQVYVRDISGCTSFDIGTIIQQQNPPTLNTPIVQNQCDPTSTAFDITVSVPNTVDTPRFTLGGDTQFGVLNGGVYEYTFTVASPGDYPVMVEDADGCSSVGTATVYEFLSASGGFTTESTCNDADGVITILPIGGSGDFDFDLTGLDYLSNPVSISQTNNPIFTGIFPGSYQVIVTDRIVNDGLGFCSFTVNNINLDAAVPPIILTATAQDISCNGADDGSIDIVLQPGSDVDGPFDYRLVDFATRALIANNASGSFPNLVPGTYEVEVISTRNCSVLSGPLDIVDPLPFSITASAPDFACEPGANRFSSTIITINIVDPGTATGGYQYSISGFSNYQSANTFEIVDTGSPQNITVYAIDGNGCQTTFDLPTINPPTDVVPTVIELDPLNCRDDERVRIQVIGTTDFTVSTISAVAVGPVTNTPGNNYVDVYLPAAGDYLFEVQDNVGGCAYPMPKHTVIDPIEPIATISEAKPISCFGGSDGELAITVTNYTGPYTYNVYSGNDPGKTTVLATGSLDTSNNPENIAGLPGGNFFVEIIASADPYCTSDSNIATIRTPNGPLTVSAIEIGNVSCSDGAGRIEANAVGGWDSSAYTYQLWKDDGTGTYLVEVPFSAVYDFMNLSSGDYRVEVRDVEGCSAIFDINLPIVPQIDAGIREPQGLVCPNGNNAVLEAFDPTTGDAITAIAGATGGYPGAGYNYRLLYLNSNDNTDIASASGLQNSPTFIGSSGGFISGGWYAIEVSSSFDCLFVTTPYFVNPPPPVQPKLVQTRVPGCGGMGEMRLEIQNPDPLFVYEYQLIENGVPVGVYTDMIGTSALFPGISGITYQFDVRKKNASNTCLPVRSNGITMTDATGITLLPNLPDDISCASELDGRIESFINGGVGDNLFYLYIGDPGDAFAPNPSATLFRGPQDNGTFEGLPEGSVAGGNAYYIAVTSGVTCSDIAGPFEIIRPEPIVFDAVASPVSCSGQADGSITVEVLSGGVGLIQFAIEPNFNEFFSDPLTPGVYVFDDLAAGSYEILIQDENGCFEKDLITVTEPAEVTVTNVSTTPETCIGFEDGTAQLTVTGGTPFVDALTLNPYYETKLIGPDSDGSEVFVRNDNLTFTNLRGGATYVVFIQDASLCGTDTILTIQIGVDLTAAPVIQYGCEGIFPTNTVLVTMQDASLLPKLLFSLDVDDINLADTQTTWGDLPAGNHTVYIYHENGCTNTTDFTIDAYDPLTLTAIKTGANEVTASAEGGYGGYEFFFQGQSFGTDTVFTTNETGTVTVKVVDQMGCEAEVAIPFVFEGMLDIPNFFSPNGDNENDVWAPLNREFFPNITVKIYDRYGRVVAVLDQVSFWDGRYDGNELPTGDYWYVVNANDKSKVRYVGHFTLYR